MALLIGFCPDGSQQLHGQVTTEITNEKPYLYFTVMPLSLLDSYPRLRLGAEYQLNDSYSFKMDLGYGKAGFSKRFLPVFRSRNSKYKIFEIRPEIARNFRMAEHSWFYISLEGFYIYSGEVRDDKTYFHPDQNAFIHYDRVVFLREKYGGHFKLGIKIFFQDDIFVDFYAGFGVARRFLTTGDYTDSRHVEENPDSSILSDEELGTSTLPHLTVGLRFGIKIQ